MSVARIFSRYYVAGLSDCGRCRTHNEDSMLINDADGIILLADGMGGHQYGDKASLEATQLVNRLIRQYLPAELAPRRQNGFWRKLAGFWRKPDGSRQALPDTQSQIIGDILIQANQAIYQQNQTAEALGGHGMGTTLVGCRFSASASIMHVFHVGDSRLYRWRDQQLTQITKDHSAYQAWLDNGQVGEAPRSSIILRGIGPEAEVAPDVRILDVAAGDGFMLCSDGLTAMVDDETIAAVIKGMDKDNIEQKNRRLIELANLHGGEDNISVILVCQ
ncbi:protein phosphatase 2C domain-containing protein [Methylomonas sp. SURF-2]|uniref:Protein phosphatase 2C domain-containing protein n=1 Tax=Methylomonas subterranea TaxID=2952225 RepID=A0ABT1TF09_9GAMM|nr:protein phosphatase 2C domain-containing protein [Methylomonas sp. SURF-2]MCQ8104048.1 protein phosphatase 2C domain-containing protein [Methylomonas sp. SURF-2]